MTCNRAILNLEVEQVENILTNLLNKYNKVIQVTFYSKRQWNKKIAQANKLWAKERKIQGKIMPDREQLKQAFNTVYCMIRKAKRKCWQNF